MEKKQMKKFLSIALCVLMIATSIVGLASCGEAAEKSYVFTTGGAQGTYYGFTNVVANTLTTAIENAKFTAVTSGGSKANIEAIDDGDAQFAIVQNDVMINAYNGKSNFEGNTITSFSVIGAVYPEVCQIIASKDSGIKSVYDLKGKRVSIGAQGSGVVTNATQILEKHGITLDDITVQNLDSGASASAMKEGKLDAFFFTGGVPTPAIQELESGNLGITIVSLDADKIAELQAESEFYVQVDMDNNVYKSIAEGEIASAVAVTATYIVSDDVDDETAYKVTKALWEKQPEIAAAHKTGAAMNIKTALLGMANVPVNAGAKRYYEEYLAKYNADNGTSLTFDEFYYAK
jgi:TRAP transporter TAXI family solute receptor